MPRSRTRIPLNVFLNGRLVGRLNRETSGAIHFEYASSWLAWEHAFPVSLSLPLREERYTGDSVVAVFENLLPDNLDVRRRLAERVHARGADAYSLLAAIGRDCIGALQFLPDSEETGKVGAVAGRPMTEGGVAAMLADLGRAPLGVGRDDGDLRISIPGTQDKTALLFWKKKWHLPAGSAATTHILKPQIGVLRNGIDLSRSVENEHLCMRLVSALGLAAAETQIVDFGDTRALVVERFDRRWTRDRRLLRVPQEDCCQALSVPPARKYESDGGPGFRQMLEFLKASDDPEQDRAFFIKAQIVFWLLGATDGHAKNFSIFLYPGGGFRLTPLYDVMSVQPSLDAGQLRRRQAKLAMAIGTQRHYALESISPRHFVQSAEQARVRGRVVEQLMGELVDAAPAAIAAATQALPRDFPEDTRMSIVGGFERRLDLIRKAMVRR